jgi:hypothetical protein
VKNLKLAARFAAKILDKNPDITKEDFFRKIDERLDDNDIGGDFEYSQMYAVIAESSTPSSQVSALPQALQEFAASKPALADKIKKMSTEQLAVSLLIPDPQSFISHHGFLLFLFTDPFGRNR